jgi:excisionase family DNA binding protein
MERLPEFLNVRELGELLRLSNTSIYRLVERREIAFIRLPRGLRFSRTDIEEYLARHRTEQMK